MCGIFGFATTKKIPRAWQLVVQLALYNESRGRQSWGVTWLPKNGKAPLMDKDVGEISRNLYRMPLLNSGILIGHTRAATIGNISKENAHPFVFSHGENTVVGVHNGGLSNHTELNAKLQRNFEVDSMHIFAHLAEERDMKEINGSGAIVFFKNNMLWMSKFNGGQLSVAKLKEDEGIVWSSDEKALETALEGANLDYSILNTMQERLYFFENTTLFHNQEKIGISARVHIQQPTIYRSNNHQTKKIERSIRFRIIRDTHKDIKALPAKTDRITDDNKDDVFKDIDAIKKEIFNNHTISYNVTQEVPCKFCQEMTGRRRTPKQNGSVEAHEPVCLTCLAWEEYGERYKITGTAQ